MKFPKTKKDAVPEQDNWLNWLSDELGMGPGDLHWRYNYKVWLDVSKQRHYICIDCYLAGVCDHDGYTNNSREEFKRECPETFHDIFTADLSFCDNCQRSLIEFHDVEDCEITDLCAGLFTHDESCPDGNECPLFPECDFFNPCLDLA